MDLSIVATLYHSAPYIDEFHRRATQAAERLGLSFEVIYVNDGSPDESQAVAEAICDRDPRVRVLELSRNFGHHKAIMTGLADARGALVFLIDSDLEEAPELLSDYHAALRAQAADLVLGVQERRKGGQWERWSGVAFYSLVNWLLACDVPRNQIVARLMTRAYVRALVAHQDRQFFFAGLCAITGFRQRTITVHKLSKGTSTYTLKHKLAVVTNALTSFSTAPLWGVFYLGCLILALTTGGTAVVLAQWAFGQVLSGWTSVVISIWLLGGLGLFSLGVNGIYLAKVFAEVKRRPYTVVRSVYGNEARGEGGDGLYLRAG
jgi:putative glycosyltransferase